MRRFSQNKKGWTLIELMISMVSASIFMLVVGSLLFFGWSGWLQNSASVEMQRDISLAMQVMTREIRCAESIATSADTLECVTTSNSMRFVRNGRNLDWMKDGVFQMHLARGGVDRFASVESNGCVSVELRVSTDHDRCEVKQQIYSRNIR